VFGVGFLASLVLPLLAAQEAERMMMMEKVGHCVVALRTADSHGSGLILDEQGTILTNAHVIVDPLPMRVEAQFKENGTLRSAHFTKVVLIGVHPERDLALVRIDPSEHKAKLTPITIGKSRVVTGDIVHAIGFPGSRGGHVKVCTTGEVTGVDKFVDMPGYFEFSAEVHQGNSGGPIVDPSGNAVGVVTRGKINGEPVAWAIPLWDLRPDRFVPLDRRSKDPAKASKILRYAEESLKNARQGRLFGMMAGELFQMALVEDISNPDTYFKVGMIQRHFGENASGAAYLMRALQLQPWSDNKQLVYHELGITLYRLRKTAEAQAVWNEGIAKFPAECGEIWDDMAVVHFEEARFLEAAVATRASIRVFGSRGQRMNEIYDQCRKRLDPEGISKLTAREQALAPDLEAAKKKAAQARESGRRFITEEAEKVVQSYEGVQREATGFNFDSLGKGPNAPKPLDIPDKDLLPLFIQSRIAAAGEHLQSGKIALAVEVLEDVIKTYPTHPYTETARELLALIKNKK
jgi:tetratricopeptide (TPR) repeat protein